MSMYSRLCHWSNRLDNRNLDSLVRNLAHCDEYVAMFINASSSFPERSISSTSPLSLGARLVTILDETVELPGQITIHPDQYIYDNAFRSAIIDVSTDEFINKICPVVYAPSTSFNLPVIEYLVDYDSNNTLNGSINVNYNNIETEQMALRIAVPLNNLRGSVDTDMYLKEKIREQLYNYIYTKLDEYYIEHRSGDFSQIENGRDYGSHCVNKILGTANELAIRTRLGCGNVLVASSRFLSESLVGISGGIFNSSYTTSITSMNNYSGSICKIGSLLENIDVYRDNRDIEDYATVLYSGSRLGEEPFTLCIAPLSINVIERENENILDIKFRIKLVDMVGSNPATSRKWINKKYTSIYNSQN